MELSVKEWRTRFLFPFRYDDAQKTAAGEALRKLMYVRPDQPGTVALKLLQVWKSTEPAARYFDEYLGHVREEFGATSETYWKVDTPTAREWFGRYVHLSRKPLSPTVSWNETRRLTLDPAGIELFLLRSGCGVLSIAVREQPETELPLEAAKAANYGLSQYHFDKSFFLGFSREANTLVPPAVTKDDRETLKRLGKRGGWFRLTELAEYLLSPLKGQPQVAYTPIHPEQQFMVYTVMRLQHQWTVSSIIPPPGPAVIDLVAHAAALAQIEEDDHPLPPPGEPGVPVTLLSTHHLAAVASQGSAHFVTDQGVGFDDQRSGQVIEKYFTAFLLALLQRLTLRRLRQEAAQLNPSGGKSIEERIDALRKRTFQFSASNPRIEISFREAVNRYFELAQTGQRVPEELRLLHQSIADIGVALDSERQGRSLTALDNSQKKLEWIEVAVISIYAAELTHILAEVFRFDPQFSSWAVVSAMVVTPIVSIGLLHLWKEGGRRLLLTAAVLALAFAAYVEWGIYRRDHHAAELRELREEIEILTDQLTLSRYAGHPRIANLVQLGSVFSSQASISESSHDLEGTRHALKKAEELLTSASETAKAAEMASDARDRFLQECNATCSTEPETEARSRRAEQAWEMGDFREAASQWRDAALPKVRKPDRR